MPEILLHQWEMSPFCNKTRRCLSYKGLRYGVQDYNGLLARKAANLSAVGKLPVLDYDGSRVADSSRIAEFLDQRHPERPLYPREREPLAAVRLWEDWAGQSLYFYEIYFRMLDPVSVERGLDLICKGRPRWERVVMKAVFKRRYPRKLAQQGLGRLPRETVEQQFFTLLADLDVVMGGRTWLVGQTLTLADLAVAAQIDELLRTSDLAPRVRALPHLGAWLARVDAAAPA